MIKRSWRQWWPPLLGLVAGLVTAVIYTATVPHPEGLAYVKILGFMAVPFLFPVLGKREGYEYPVSVNALITVHILLAGYWGSILGFYDTVPGWDLLMHGLFGVVASAVWYMLLLRWNGAALHPVGFHFTLCFGVMGGAALWEMFEYVCDLTLGLDTQRVQEALRLGVSPVEDTMTDIIITAAGIAVFYLFLVIKRTAHRETR